MKHRMIIRAGRLLLTGLLAGALVACNGDKAEQEQQAAVKAVEAFSLLDKVPADAPYLFVSSRGMPKALSEKLVKASGEELDNGSAREGLQQMLAPEDRQSRAARLADAFLAELEGKMNAQGLASLGLSINGRGLTYGLGLLPVSWIEIEDADKVRALLQRLQKNSGVEAQSRRVGDLEYLHFDLGKLNLEVAFRDQWLVLALMPAQASPELLSLALGETPPEVSLGSTGRFKRFVGERGFLGHGDGYIDVVRMTAMLMGDAEGPNARMLEALQFKPATWSPACKAWTRNLAVSVPLLSIGFTEATSNRYVMLATVETLPGVAAWLKGIAAPVPGVGTVKGELFNLGMGLDLPQLREALKAMLRNMIETGAGCEKVDEQELTQMIQAMDVMLNPLFAGIKGFNLNVNDLAVDLQTMQPRRFEGGFILSAADPRGMFGLLGMLSPKLAQLDIPADGKPVRLPLESLSLDAPPTYVAIRDSLLVFEAGASAPAGIEGLLTAEPAKTPPLLALGYSPAGLFEAMGPDLKQMMASKAPEQREDVEKAYRSMERQASVYRRVDVRVTGTDRGLEIRNEAELN